MERTAGSYSRALAVAIALVALGACAKAEPPGLVERVRAGLSAGRPIEDVGAIRMVTTVETADSVIGRGEVVASRSPLRYREMIEVAGVRQTATVIGDRGWYEDPNGRVRAVSGDELATYRLAHALLFQTWLDDPEPAGFERVVEGDTVRFVPREDGATRSLGFADSDGVLLPSELRQRQQGTEVGTTFEDWRVVDGVRIPFRSVQRTGDPRFDLAMVTTEVEVSDELPADAITTPVEGHPEDARVLDPAAAGAIPIELVGNLPVVEVDVGGRDGLLFLIDSGAGATVVASSLAEELDLPSRGTLEARGGGGSEAASFVDLPPVRLPGVEVDGQTVVTLPLDGLAETLGRPIRGILGWDFLSRFVVELDYPGRRLALFAPGTYEPRTGASPVPLRVEANVPRVTGAIDGHAGSFLLDTGNAARLFVHASFAREIGLIDRAEESEILIAGIGGEEATMGAVIDRLDLGDVSWTHVPATLPSTDVGILALDEAIGNVGSALFADAVIALDYDEGVFWIWRAASASER
ncbi:MAG: aspartyl protease family protein [Gemmatimonadetes bacterium]|nr:aspartyl protease family protein [Gemmatimonadota bacterium]